MPPVAPNSAEFGCKPCSVLVARLALRKIGGKLWQLSAAD
jgi:hypothetical protein